MKAVTLACRALAAVFAASSCGVAAEPPPSALSTFPLGGSRGAICTAQAADSDPALRSMFDRAYRVICRDAASPIANLYVLRRRDGDPLPRLAAARAGKVDCGATRATTVDDLGAVEAADCRLKDADVGYRVYVRSTPRAVYVAEGLAGYDSALTIGLRTLVSDRPVQGEIMIATTDVGDSAAFARVQAGTLSITDALAEGYRRNNRGDFADASEFFASMLRRDSADIDPNLQNEYLVNRALQQSNLANFPEADALLAQAEMLPTTDQVQLRLRRNFKALHLLNQRRLPAAQAELERPMAPMPRAGAGAAAAGGTEIDAATAARINAEAGTSTRVGEDTELTPIERARVLDGQARQLHGTVLRLRGDLAGADADFEQATREILAVRGGRFRSATRLLVQILAEQATVAERRGDLARAERLLRRAVVLVDQQYPETVAARASQARLAAYLSRHGQTAEALALYGAVVKAATQDRTNAVSPVLLAPYLELLAANIPTRPELVADFFLASETMARPGVANTQAVLARELSAGSGEAARLFRQSVTLARDIERMRLEIAALNMMPQRQPADEMRASALQANLEQSSAQQIATQAKLADYPQYRAISDQALTLADLQQSLHEDEGYLKLAAVENAVYAIYVTKKDATAYRTAIDAATLDDEVQKLRDTIRLVKGDVQETYPLDLARARSLYVALIQPIASRLDRIAELVFEPDGGMLRLPVSLLPTDQPSVDAYEKRVAAGADPFDFRGVRWLGRRVAVTTAVSARAFRDVRASPPSQAKEQYLGLGENAPVSAVALLSDTRATIMSGGVDCNFPLAAWNQPISASELYTARRAIGESRAEVISGPAFSDTAMIERKDLDQFRVLHFATHGVVDGPAPSCPAQPALVTSFGGKDSDGLLTFREVYDLRIDADLVILSACDTAAGATVEATRRAGLTSGGGFALDGLVRAFVGAGARTVVASHWPVPNEYDATERLISGLFEAPPGTSTAEALRGAELALMDDAATSHPYYWAAFAIIGDGASPVIRK